VFVVVTGWLTPTACLLGFALIFLVAPGHLSSVVIDVVQLEDRRVVHQPVDRRHRHAWVGEELRPAGEWLIGGDEDAAKGVDCRMIALIFVCRGVSAWPAWPAWLDMTIALHHHFCRRTHRGLDVGSNRTDGMPSLLHQAARGKRNLVEASAAQEQLARPMADNAVTGQAASEAAKPVRRARSLRGLGTLRLGTETRQEFGNRLAMLEVDLVKSHGACIIV
jgi:hypothetical protein